MASKDQIVSLLGLGLSNTEVALAVGVEPSYITQLMADDEFAAEVTTKRAAALTANSRRDASIDTIEDKLLNKLEEIVDNQQLYKPMEVLRAASVVNQMKRRGVQASSGSTVINNIVNLTLPAAVKRQYTLNNQSEVVDTDGQTLVTMPTSTLLKELANKRSSDENGETYQRLQRHLPSVKAG